MYYLSPGSFKNYGGKLIWNDQQSGSVLNTKTTML